MSNFYFQKLFDKQNIDIEKNLMILDLKENSNSQCINYGFLCIY